MLDLVICELCGNTYNSFSIDDNDICPSCRAIPTKCSNKKLGNNKKSIDNAKKHRQLASSLNLKALKGSAKQKSWGEVIREQLISKIGAEEPAIELLSSCMFEKASWFIDKRNDLDNAAKNLKLAYILRNKCNDLHELGKSSTDEYNTIANQYANIVEQLK